MKHIFLMTSLLTSLICFASPRAEVASASAHGFKVTIQVQIDASPGRVYNTLVKQVGAWWHPDHAFYGDAGKLSIEDRPNGCFCERSGKGQVRHMTVIFAEPGKVLRMTDALGPLQELGVTGNMGFKFSEAEGGHAGGVLLRCGRVFVTGPGPVGSNRGWRAVRATGETQEIRGNRIARSITGCRHEGGRPGWIPDSRLELEDSR